MSSLPVLISFNFESDNESHLNGSELSELSDQFDDELEEFHEVGLSRETEVNSSLTIDDIPYDRDLKYVNVPNTTRKKGVLAVASNENAGNQPNRLLKQVKEIAKHNQQELTKLDDHYRKLDEKKKFNDDKYAKKISKRSKGGRFKEQKGDYRAAGNIATAPRSAENDSILQREGDSNVANEDLDYTSNTYCTPSQQPAQVPLPPQNVGFSTYKTYSTPVNNYHSEKSHQQEKYHRHREREFYRGRGQDRSGRFGGNRSYYQQPPRSNHNNSYEHYEGVNYTQFAEDMNHSLDYYVDGNFVGDSYYGDNYQPVQPNRTEQEDQEAGALNPFASEFVPSFMLR
jgi:hypothetical protein